MKIASRWKLPKELDEQGQFSRVEKHRAEIRKYEETGKQVLLFLGSNPPREGFVNKPLNDALIEAAEGGTEGYPGDSTLFADLREAISNFVKKRRDIVCPPDNIIVGPGAAGCFTSLQYAILDKGDEVLAIAPCHYISGPSKYLDIFGTRLVVSPTIEEEGWKPDYDELRKNISSRTKFIMICNPNNPDGAVWSEKTLKNIVNIVGEHDAIIVSDEMYSLITFDGVKSPSVVNVSGDVPSISISGMSKFFMRPGWRIGFLCFHDPDNHVPDALQMTKKVAYMYGHPNKSIPSPILYSALKAYQDYKGAFKAGLEMVKETQRHRDYVVKRLNEIEGIECQTPKGALYAFPKISLIGKKWKTDLDFLLDLLREEGVAWHMGTRYGKSGYGHLRVLLQPKLDKLEDGFNRLERFLDRHS